jgi:tripeptide aminopeptidase
MTAARKLLEDNPGGEVRVCFSPDEEIGRGAVELPLDVLKADVAYTLDACEVGELCYETFSADKAVVTVTGVSIHPGFATGKLVNALNTAADILNALPRELTPEGTSGRQGFLHATDLKGSAHLCTLSFILRAFEPDELEQHRERLRKACELPTKCRVDLEFIPQYRNMRDTLQQDMRPVELAVEAYERCGIAPRFIAFRGGTDGSILTARGLPTPNLFCGMQNFHGPLEWVSLQDMEQAVHVCLQLVSLWGRQPAAAPGRHQPAS